MIRSRKVQLGARRRFLRVEQLEDRRQLAVTASFNLGVLTFTGDTADDTVTVGLTTYNNVQFQIGSTGAVQTVAFVDQINFNAGGGNDVFDIIFPRSAGTDAPVNGISFGGGPGNDRVTMSGGSTADFPQSTFTPSGPTSGTYFFGGASILSNTTVTLTSVENIDDSVHSTSFQANGTGGGDTIGIGSGAALDLQTPTQQGPIIIDGANRDTFGLQLPGGTLHNFATTFQDLESPSNGWSLNTNPNIDLSSSRPHVTVRGTGDNTVDFYRINVPVAGSLGTFDIDGTDPAITDIWLAIYDDMGQLLFDRDDYPTVDPGSVPPFVGGTNTWDSYIPDFVFPTAGNYYIGVAEFPATAVDGGWALSSSIMDPGEVYTLNISVEGHPLSANTADVNEVEPNSSQTTLPPTNTDGWKFIEQAVDFVNRGAFNTANRQILAIGVDANSQARRAIDSAAAVLGLQVDYANDAQISSVNFDSYRVLYVPSNSSNTSGGISGPELDLLTSREAAIRSYLSNGGGIVALTDAFTPASGQPYSWLKIPSGFSGDQFINGTEPQSSTTEMLAAGFTITNTELNSTAFRNTFTGPVGFNGLTPFVTTPGPDLIAGTADDGVVTLGQGPIYNPTGSGQSTLFTLGNPGTPLRLQVAQKGGLIYSAGGGADTITLDGSIQALNNITQSLLIQGGSGNNRLLVNDAADLLGDTIQIIGTGSTTQVVGLAQATISFQQFADVSLSGTSGDDTITIQNLELGGLTRLTVDGADGADVIGTAAAPVPVSSTVQLYVVGGGAPVGSADRAVLDAVGIAGLAFIDVDGGRVLTQTGATVRFFGIEQPWAVVEPGLVTDLSAGDLLVVGTAQNDTVVFYRGAQNDSVLVKHRVLGQPFRTYGPFRVTGKIVAEGGAGADYFELTRSLAGLLNAELRGGVGSDTLIGGDKDDWLVGGGGNDRLLGRGGNDVLWGDAEATVAVNNRVGVAGDGNDILIGGSGADRLFGGGGRDTLQGGDGDDYLQGGLGNDTLRGEGNNDVLRGDDGNDQLDGGVGADILDGGDGDDNLAGRAGRDVVIGGRGTDLISDDDTDEDLLVSERTKYDADNGVVAGLGTNDLDLQKILLEWLAVTTIAVRRNNISNGGGLNGSARISLADGSLFADSSIDRVAGLANNTGDWIITRQSDLVTGVNGFDTIDQF